MTELSQTQDSTVRWFDLIGFRLRLLCEISQLDQPSGQTIRRRIEDQTGEDINHGKLYPNLDSLVQDALVDKGDQDRRTNYYEITASGQLLVDDAAEDFQEARSRPIAADGGEDPSQ